MPFIQFKSIPLNYTLRRSLRAKRLHMVLRQAHFEVVAPPKIPNAMILQFVFAHQSWMARNFQKQKKREEPFSLWPNSLTSLEKIFLRGEKLGLNIKFGPKKATRQQNESLQLTISSKSLCANVTALIKKQIIDWYQEQAFRIIEECLAHYCPLLGRWPKAIRLKQQKTRWGSCGIDEKIYLNWLLVLAPPGVLEYVVVHELCHLFHRNHGKRFWQKVKSVMPNFEEYEDWLTKKGQTLKPQPSLEET